MKKTIALLLCVVMLIGLLPVSVFAAGTNRFIITPNKTEVLPGEEVVFTISMESAEACDMFGLMLEFDADVFEFVSGKFDRNFGYDENDDNLVATKTFNTTPGKEGVAVSLLKRAVYSGKVGTFTLKAKEIANLTQATVTATTSVKCGNDTLNYAMEAASVCVLPVEPAETTAPETEPTVPETKPPVEPPVEPSSDNRFVFTANKTQVNPGEEVVFTISMESVEACDMFGLMLEFDADAFEFVNGKFDRNFGYDENEENLVATKTFSATAGKEGVAVSMLKSVVYSGKVGTFTLKAKAVADLTETVVTATSSAKCGNDTVHYGVEAASVCVLPAESTEPTVPETEPTVPEQPASENRIVITPDKAQVNPGEEIVFSIAMESVQACDMFGLLLKFDTDVFEFVSGSFDSNFGYGENETDMVAAKTFETMPGKEGIAVSFLESVVYNGIVGTFTLRAKEVTDLTQTEVTAISSAKCDFDTVQYAVEAASVCVAPIEPTEPSVPDEPARNHFVIVADKTEVFPGDQITFTLSVEMEEFCDSFGLILEFDRDMFELVKGKFNRDFGYDEDDNNIVLVKNFSDEAGKEGFAVSFNPNYCPCQHSGVVGTFTLKVKDGAEFDTSVVSGAPAMYLGGEKVRVDVSEIVVTMHKHTYVEYEAKAPTCDEIGWNAYHTCEGCGDTNYVELPAIGHAWNVYEAVAPTCNANGNIAYQQCANCGAAQTWEENPKPLGKFGWVLAAAHTGLEHHEAVVPTCIENGHEAFDYCNDCQVFIYADPLKLTYQAGVIPALGHTWVDYAAVAPTCTTDGNIAYQQCSVCGAAQTWEENPKPLSKSGWVLAAAHTGLEHHEAVAPTCVENGHEAFDYCNDCQVFIYDDPLKLTYQAGIILPLGHKWEEKVDAKYLKSAATCTESAVYYTSCSVCGETGTETFTHGEPLGHSYENGKCQICEFMPGDVDGNKIVDNKDVVRLLWYTLFPNDYEVTAAAEVNNDGKIDNKDVVYLLWYTLFPSDYPLY